MAKESVLLSSWNPTSETLLQPKPSGPPAASQIVREFMREFVQRQREAREHDAWFRARSESR